MSDDACKNTDTHLWPIRTVYSELFEDSIHVTANGNIGMNCGGHVIVKTLAEWHKLAVDACDHRWSDPSRSADSPCHCMSCGIPKVTHINASATADEGGVK